MIWVWIRVGRSVPVEEHERAWVVEFVHLERKRDQCRYGGEGREERDNEEGETYFIEVWDLGDIHFSQNFS
jgi:hypothetical protein